MTREPGDLPERVILSSVRGARLGRTSAVVTEPMSRDRRLAVPVIPAEQKPPRAQSTKRAIIAPAFVAFTAVAFATSALAIESSIVPWGLGSFLQSLVRFEETYLARRLRA